MDMFSSLPQDYLNHIVQSACNELEGEFNGHLTTFQARPSWCHMNMKQQPRMSPRKGSQTRTVVTSGASVYKYLNESSRHLSSSGAVSCDCCPCSVDCQDNSVFYTFGPYKPTSCSGAQGCTGSYNCA